jgi:polyphosphate kinase 2 (PPK2 family)
MSKSEDYDTELVQLQLALIALQKKAIETGDKIVLVLEWCLE